MRSPRRQTALRVVLLLSLLPLIGLNSPQPAASAEQDLRWPNYFEETGYWLQGPFREYWETHGGLYIFGYPITSVFEDDGLYKQYFERAIFEWHPENAGTQYEVLLQRLGAIRTAHRTNENPFKPITVSPDSNCNFYPETGHRLCFGFRTYWTNNGGLPNFGYPLSEEFTERNDPPPAGDGLEHTVQYFERARFEYHPEYAGTQFETLLGLLGSEYLGRNPVASEITARQARDLPPPDPTTGALYGPHVGYGYNVFLRGDERDDREDFNNQTLSLATSAGFTWIHIQVRWDGIEPYGPQGYDPAGLDRLIDDATASEVKLLVSVVGPSPGWAGAGGGIPADMTHYQKLMEFLANRYRGRVHAWEVLNEQNIAANVGGTIDIGRYVAILKAGYLGVKASDPNAIVLFGALTPTGIDDAGLAIDDVRYLERFYAYNNGEARAYFDVLGAHPGSNSNPPDASWPDNPGPGPGWTDHSSFYFRRIEDLRAVMVANGDADKQIWLTEFGWTTANQSPGYEYGASNSEQEQAQYLVRAYEIARTEWPWMGVMFVWNLNYSIITEPGDEKFPWSVLYADWSPRPSYEALKQMPK